MPQYTNNHDLPISVAAWLLDDGYDHAAKADPNTFSVTEILKPVRQVILGRRVDALPQEEQMPVDVISLYNSRIGQTLHSGIENTWLNPQEKLVLILKKLGIAPYAAKKIQINPSPEELDTSKIFLYMEQRRTVKVNETYSLTGQYDFNFCGQLEDFKNTKTYALTMGVNDDYYTKQGSCYRYLFPEQLTQDTTQITFLFSDWMASRVGAPDYPSAPIDYKKFPLMTPLQTETFIVDKFDEIDRFKDVAEPDLPKCTSEDLWEEPTVWKYYSNPDNKGRATKNFNSGIEAAAHLQAKGKGEVVEVQGKIKACAYCKAFPLCTQKDEYLIQGRLNI